MIGLFIQFNSQKTKPLTDFLANKRRIFTDARRKDYSVDTTQNGQIGTDILDEGMHVNVNRRNRILISFQILFLNVTQIRVTAGQPILLL